MYSGKGTKTNKQTRNPTATIPSFLSSNIIEMKLTNAGVKRVMYL